MCAFSPVIKAMFDSGMKEAQENSMEINEFEPAIIEKMVEFCQTETIAAFDGQEEEVFKIAHKYQIQELMVSFFFY